MAMAANGEMRGCLYLSFVFPSQPRIVTSPHVLIPSSHEMKCILLQKLFPVMHLIRLKSDFQALWEQSGHSGSKPVTGYRDSTLLGGHTYDPKRHVICGDAE